MGYDIFRFGALYVDNKIQPIPQQPILTGDVPSYDGHSRISIGPTGQEQCITWVKPYGSNLLIADRVLLDSVSWEALDRSGFITGKPIRINGQHFRCRLLRVGEKKGDPNEWDKTLDETGDAESDTLWHWAAMFFWGIDVALNASSRVVRGYYSARYSYSYNTGTKRGEVGFRPALEPLPSDVPIPNINLEGIGFQLSRLPGNDAFYPILQPTQEDVFKDILVGGKVRMYTFMEDGKPIHAGAAVKDISKLTLTDRYYGDEFLIPWVISNGVAVASQSLSQQI